MRHHSGEVGDVGKTRPSSSKKGIRIPVWMKVTVILMWVAIIVCFGVMPVITRHNAQQKTLADCRAKANTIQSVEAQYDEKGNQIVVRLQGFSTDYETPIIIDGSKIATAKNELVPKCHQAGFDIYGVDGQAVIPNCSVKTIGFQSGGKFIKEHMDIESACLQYKWHYEKIEKLCSVEENIMERFRCMSENGLGEYFIVREY